MASASAASPAYVSDFLATSEGLALTRAFTRISDAKLRRSIVDLVEQVASREPDDRSWRAARPVRFAKLEKIFRGTRLDRWGAGAAFPGSL